MLSVFLVLSASMWCVNGGGWTQVRADSMVDGVENGEWRDDDAGLA